MKHTVSYHIINNALKNLGAPEHSFKVVIEEHVSDEFNIVASTKEEALEKAKQQYDLGEIVLEPGSVVYKEAMAYDPLDEDDCTEWEEF